MRPRLAAFARRHGLQLLALLIIATLLRTWQIGRFPPGLFGDEAVNGLDALDVLAGRGAIFFPANFGREGAHIWLVAGAIRLFGDTAFAVRLPSILAGVAAVLATYWLGVELVRQELTSSPRPPETSSPRPPSPSRRRGSLGTWQVSRAAPSTIHPGQGQALPLRPTHHVLRFAPSTKHPGQGQALPLRPTHHVLRFAIYTLPFLAALYMATSYWHIHTSRFGIRGVFTSLWAALAFAAFWRGVNTGRTRWFVACGLFLGAGVNFYTASRFVPVFLLLFLVMQAAVVWWLRRRAQDPPATALLARYSWPLVVAALVALLVVVPLGYYFLSHPGSFASRAAGVSAFNVDVSGGRPWLRMLQAAAANIGQFFIPGAGDQAAFYNLPGRAVFDPLSALLALIGLSVCLRRWRQPVYLFLLLWPPVMLVPTFLAVDRFPTLPRAQGVVPGIYFWAALGLLAGVSWLVETWRRRVSAAGVTALAALLLASALLVHAGLAVRDYFYVWGPSATAYDAFDGPETETATWLQTHSPPAPVYLSADLYRHPVIMFLYERVPLSQFFSFHDPNVHWFDAREAFVLPPDNGPATYVFSGPAQPAPATLAAWLPQRTLRYEGRAPDGSLSTVVVSGSASNPSSQIAAAFMNGLDLSGFTLSVTPTSGAVVDVTLVWRIAGLPPPAGDSPPESGYKVRVALLAAGRPQAGVEQLLAYRPAEWTVDEQVLSFQRLALPPDAPADGYRLAVALVTEAGEVVPLVNGEPEMQLDIGPHNGYNRQP